MQYRPKLSPVTAVRWLAPGDHPDVRASSTRWATPEDPSDCVVDRERAAEYNKIGYVPVGVILDEAGSELSVGAGDWIVTSATGQIAVIPNDEFLAHYEPVGEAAPAPAPAPEVAPVALTIEEVPPSPVVAPAPPVEPTPSAASPVVATETLTAPMTSEPASVEPSAPPTA